MTVGIVVVIGARLGKPVAPVLGAEIARAVVARRRDFLNASSWPRSSSSVVTSVQARNRDGVCGSGTRRTTPAPRPNAVSNSNSASIVSVPARVTQRGGVRFAGK